MPKDSKLKGKIGISQFGSKLYRIKTCQMTWQGRYIKFATFNSIDLAETLGWEVVHERKTGSKTADRIIRIKVWSKKKRKAVEWQLKPTAKEFETWLYWIMSSILNHSNAEVLDSKIKGLKERHRGKLQARRDMKAFDLLHGVFVSAIGRVNQGKNLSDKGEFKETTYATGMKKDQKNQLKLLNKILGLEGNDGIKKEKWNMVGEGGARGRATKYIAAGGGGGEVFIGKIYTPAQGGVPVIIKSTNIGTTYGKVDKSEEAQKKRLTIINEVRIHAALGAHPNIIGLVDALVTKDRLWVFLEKGEEDLKTRVARLTTAGKRLNGWQIMEIARGIMTGLCHMHLRRIYHFDIKPANIVFSLDGTPKLIDFGMARAKMLSHGKDDYSAGVGSAGFIPPEAMGGRHNINFRTFYSKQENQEKFDSYSAGITILLSLVGTRCGLSRARMVKDNPELVKSAPNDWSTGINKPAVQKKLKALGLEKLADVALGMIAEDYRKRLTVTQALSRIEGVFGERKIRAKTSKEKLERRRKGKFKCTGAPPIFSKFEKQ